MDKQRWFVFSLGAFVAMGIVQLLGMLIMSTLPASSPLQALVLHIGQWNFLVGSALALGAGLVAYPLRRLQTWWVLPCGVFLARALALMLPHP